MNDQQHAFWLAYIRHLADLMRLKDWEISLSRTGPESPTSDAQNFLYYGQRACEISLPTQFFGRPPETQRAHIAHELTHCHIEDLNECVRLYINNNGHMDDLIAQVYQREMEVLTDTIALVVAPFLPLPGNVKRDTENDWTRDNLTDNFGRPPLNEPYMRNGSWFIDSLDSHGIRVIYPYPKETATALGPTNGAVR